MMLAGASLSMCASASTCLFNFQTFISGVLAILAAIGTTIIVWRAAKLPLKRQAQLARERGEKRRLYVGSVLSSDLMNLTNRATHAASTIKVVAAANSTINESTKAKARLELHPIIEDWESMSLLPTNTLQNLLRLKQEVSDHNFDVDRAGGAFGADNFRQSMLSRLSSIQGRAQVLAGQAMLLARPTQLPASRIRRLVTRLKPIKSSTR